MNFKEEQIVITGAGGQLGTELAKFYPKAKALRIENLELTDENAVEKFNWKNVKVIINAAAWTNVDVAELPENKDKVWAVNVNAVENLAKIAQEKSAILIHISSDYVFDGKMKNHSETEKFSPLNFYGKSKAAGDLAAKIAKKHYILRTSWVVGTNESANNFAKTMFNLAQKNVSPKVVNDQFGRLTFTSEIVRGIDFILKKSPEFGTYNLTNSGEIKNWCEIAAEIYKLAGNKTAKIQGISTKEYFEAKENIASRPKNSDLDLSKIQKTGFKSKDYESLLEKYIKTLSKK